MLSDLIFKGLFAIGLCVAAWGAWHQFTGHYIEIGRVEVRHNEVAPLQAKYDAAVKRASDLANLWAKSIGDAAEKARKQKETDDAAISTLQARVAALSPLPTLHFSTGAWSLWDAATAAANAPDPSAAPGAPGRAASVPESAPPVEGITISEQAFADYTLKASAAYRTAVRWFHECRNAYNGIHAANPQEKP